MNRVELFGTIASEVIASILADGSEHASTSLHFHKGNGAVLIFSFGERAQKLARFKHGDLVKISGRLTIHPLNGKAAILVAEVDHLDSRQQSDEDREVSEWNAVRRHQGNAAVKDNRWAARAGYVK